MTTVQYLVEGHVAKIVLNRPDKRNAFNSDMCRELQAAARAAADHADIRLVLVRANGPVFCAGADLAERKGMSDEAVRTRRQLAFDAYAALEALPMPTVAIVEGLAVGSGVEICAACDFIVASPAAGFRTPEALWGTVGATQRLARVMGPRVAKELMFTGRTMPAAEAHMLGFVSRVVAPQDVDAVIAEIAHTIVNAPPQALAAAKRCIDRGSAGTPADALALEQREIEALLARGDGQLSAERFAERRP